MSRLAVRKFMGPVAESAADAIAANTRYRLTVADEVPEYAKLGSHLVVVVGPLQLTESRLSGTRGYGQKRRDYNVPIVLFANGKLATVEEDFETAQEVISAAFASCNVPTGITDPVTGAQSTLLTVGEQITTTEETPLPVTVQMSQFTMQATLLVRATEIITA